MGAKWQPHAHQDWESKVRAAMGPQDAKLFRITELLHALAARQDVQASELANLARLPGRPTDGLTEGKQGHGKVVNSGGVTLPVRAVWSVRRCTR
jgi:hypothetical protein